MSNIFFVQPNRDFRSDVLCGQSCRDAKPDKTALEFEVKDLKKKLESKEDDLRWAEKNLVRGRWHGLSFFYMLKVKTTAKIYDKINTCMSKDFV
jgi:hypothetical protein